VELWARVGHPHLVGRGARGLCALPPTPPSRFSPHLLCRAAIVVVLLACLPAWLPAWRLVCWPEFDCWGSSALSTSTLHLLDLIGGGCHALLACCECGRGPISFEASLFKAGCSQHGSFLCNWGWTVGRHNCAGSTSAWLASFASKSSPVGYLDLLVDRGQVRGNAPLHREVWFLSPTRLGLIVIYYSGRRFWS
jgi:hypothetical protein